EDNGEPLLLLLAGDPVQRAVAAEGDAVEEDQGAAGLVKEAERDPSLDEGDEEAADLLRLEAVGRGLEVGRQLGDGPEVSRLGVRGEVAHLHILKHALAERRHEDLRGGRSGEKDGETFPTQAESARAATGRIGKDRS